jgi:hypothetical protein
MFLRPRLINLLRTTRKFSTTQPPQIDKIETKNEPDKLETLNEQLKDLQDLYRRSLADAQNLRQRTKKEVEEARIVISFIINLKVFGFKIREIVIGNC